jgi:hypothetical protein
MSCISVRQRLLASERPDHPAATESRHLSSCADCRAWLRLLVRLEQRLSLVPVPPSVPPPALLAMLRSAPDDALVKPPALLSAVRPRQEGGRQKLALAIALAASLLVFAIGWWAWPHVQEDSSSHGPTLTRNSHEEQLKKRLASAHTPAQRVNALVDWADDCFRQAQLNRDDPTSVQGQAFHFRGVVKHDLPQHAQDVSPGERVNTLKDAANRLRQIDVNATRLADSWEPTNPVAAKAMRQIAVDARDAERQLREMATV